MKICIINFYFPPHPGGSEVIMDVMTKQLVEIGHEVFVVTRSYKGYPSYHEWGKVHVYRVGNPEIRYLTKTLFMFFAIPLALKVMKKHKINAIISQELFGTLPGFFAKAVYRKPYIHIHEFTAKDIPTFTNKIKMVMQRMILPNLNCDYFVSWSKFMKENYFDKWNFKKEVLVMAPGVNMNIFNPKVDGKAIRKKFGISDDTVLFMTTKPLYPIVAKDIELMVKAFPSLVKQCKNVKCMIVGDGIGKHDLQELIKKLGVEDYFIFAGAIGHDDMPKHLAAADVVCHTYVHEATMGSSLMESLAMGKAVLVSATGEIKNALDNNTAMLVKGNDVAGTARGLIELAKSAALRKKLAANAYKIAKERYSIEYMARELVRLLEKAGKNSQAQSSPTASLTETIT